MELSNQLNFFFEGQLKNYIMDFHSL